MNRQPKIYIYPLLWVLRTYQLVLSPWMTACRFKPSCSEYAIEAFKHFGFLKGLLLTVKRLVRCHPWGGHGFDPVIKEETCKKKLKVASYRRNVYKSKNK